ncbi:MAG: hypothetical protein QM734_13955 [Cyclobacteriaceae bacterium]
MERRIREKKIRFAFYFGIDWVSSICISLPYFFNNILQPKPGVQLSDPVLNFFTPKDWSIEIFILIYSSTVLSLVFNIAKPKAILLGLQSYVVVNFLRMTSLYLFTLEAPEGTIPLSDPFLTVFAYGKEVFVKDLLFSGHISTLFLLFLIEERVWLEASTVNNNRWCCGTSGLAACPLHT